MATVFTAFRRQLVLDASSISIPQLAYSRGYNAGCAGRWPAHKPPHPPDELCREMADSLSAIRDAADGWLAQFGADDDDPMHKDINAKIDQVDEVMRKVDKWIKAPEESS